MRSPARQRTTIQATQASAVRVVAGRAHDGDDLLDFGRIGGIAETLVARGSTGMEAGHGRRRPASTSTVKQHLGHRPLLGFGERDRASTGSSRSVTEAGSETELVRTTGEIGRA